MRFYGANSPKIDINQFVFDKIYSSVDDLKKDAANDGILPGRYVLVRYSVEISDGSIVFDGTTAQETEADQIDKIVNYNATVWRKTNNNNYELIAQLEPSTAIATWLKTDEGKDLVKEAISETIKTTVGDTTVIGNSYTIPQYEKNGDTLTYKGGIPVFDGVTLILNGVLE